LIWGTSFILIKQGLKIFSPDEVAALRVTSASLLLLPFALHSMKGLVGKDYFLLLVSGLAGIFIPAFLFAYAQTHLDSSVAGILNTLSPLWMMIIGSLFFGQHFKRNAIFGMMIAFGGAALLMLANSGGTHFDFNGYSLLIVIACAFYGLNLNWVKFKIPPMSAMTITSVSLLLIGPLAAIYLFGVSDFTHKLSHAEGAWKACGFIMLLGCMGTSVATIIFNKLIKISTPLFASSVTYILPIIAVMWGLADGEILISGHFIGMIAVLSGVYLANRK
jgi:drug/metabolite transporter (DMT)-like permease